MNADTGTVLLTVGDTEVTLSPANVRPRESNADREPFRAPFGTAWHTAGTGIRGPELFTITAWITSPDGISAAAALVAQATSYLITASRVVTPIGSFDNVGLQSLTVTPIQAGYRIEAILASQNGMHTTDLFFYAPSISASAAAAWIAQLEGLGYSVDEIANGTLASASLRKYQAGVVLGPVISSDKALLREAPTPLVSDMEAVAFAVEPANLETFATATIPVGQQSHPIAGGDTVTADGLAALFLAFQTIYALTNADTFNADVVAYLDDPVLTVGVRETNPSGYRRVGFPLIADVTAYAPEGLTLIAAAVAWAMHGSSGTLVTIGAAGASTVPNLIGREATIIGNESILIGAETITV